MIQGGAGPGGCDANHWQDSLLWFGAHSGRSRESVACLCRKLVNSVVPLSLVKAFMSSRLIGLDKCPGVRLVAVGETLRRAVGKVVCIVIKSDAEVVCGVNQLCAGLSAAGIEGAVHALNDLFDVNGRLGWGF